MASMKAIKKFPFPLGLPLILAVNSYGNLCSVLTSDNNCTGLSCLKSSELPGVAELTTLKDAWSELGKVGVWCFNP